MLYRYHMDYDIAFSDHACVLCGYVCHGRRSIGNHLAKSHRPTTLETYVLALYYDGVKPLCACGCGKSTNWKKIHYVFSRYCSGHNNNFTSDHQPTFTDEQIVKRNDAIRRSYKDNGKRIKKKISQGVIAAFASEESRLKLSESQKAGWARVDPMIRSEQKKRVWDAQHDELCEKIFTKEMRAKISAANMKRDMKRTSRIEHAFVSHISAYAQVVRSHWINHPCHGHACFDAYVPTRNLLIEFDGVFWHGLDRGIADHTVMQRINVANDERKNSIAASAGLRLIRISETSTWPSIRSIDDLIGIAYYDSDAIGLQIT